MPAFRVLAAIAPKDGVYVLPMFPGCYPGLSGVFRSAMISTWHTNLPGPNPCLPAYRIGIY